MALQPCVILWDFNAGERDRDMAIGKGAEGRGRCESASEGIRPLEDIGVNRASCASCAGCARARVVNLGFTCYTAK